MLKARRVDNKEYRCWVMTSSLLTRNKTQPGNAINHKLLKLAFICCLTWELSLIFMSYCVCRGNVGVGVAGSLWLNGYVQAACDCAYIVLLYLLCIY